MKRTRSGGVALAIAALSLLLAGGLGLAGGRGLAASAAAPGRPVIVIGIPGLRWSDISARTTPAIWRLAATGSVGALVTTTIHPSTCQDDAWLTLNAGIRAATSAQANRCRLVPVLAEPLAADPMMPAEIPARVLRGLTATNDSLNYGAAWGRLAAAAGHGRCATAIGPGAALALADSAGHVPRYRPALPSASRLAASAFLLRQCPLTVIDLGVTRSGAMAAADEAVGGIVAAAAPGSIIMLAGLGDDGSPHLRVVVVSGPGYRAGLLTSDSTRPPGIVTITDLTPSILRWRGQPVPSSLTGSAVRAVGRASLPAAIATMTGQDTANQVYRSTVGWFFLYYGIAEAAMFAAIALGPARRRVAWYTAAGALAAAVPAGTFLAGLVPWGRLSHPALWLYGLGLGWAGVIAVAAVAGPWRRDPFGPPGLVCAVTLAVIGTDVMTGARLQLGAPFGLSLVEAGRFYGIGNNALGVYLVAGLLTAAWAAAALWRDDPRSRRRAAAAAGAVALVTVVVAGWPGFGAKVGGTIAMGPAFLVLVAVIAGARITVRRGLIIAASGLALGAAFAVADYLGLAASSHLGTFVGQLLHGGAGGTLRRKIGSNLRSVTMSWYTLVVPVVAVATGLMLGWPARLRMRSFFGASQRSPLLRSALACVWLAVVLSWFGEDSGVGVVAAALPVAGPLSIALVIRAASLPRSSRLNGGSGEVPAFEVHHRPLPASAGQDRAHRQRERA